MNCRRVILKNRDVVLFVGLALFWLLARHFLKSALCAGPCWLEPSDWPGLLGVSEATAPWQIALLLLFLFAWPTGWTSVLATIIGIQIGFAHGRTVLDVTLLFLLATAASNVLTLWAMQKILEKPGPTRKAWLKRVNAVQKRFGFLRKKEMFWLLAAGNAFSSQLYMAAWAVAAKTPKIVALPAMLAGSMASYLLPLAVLFSAKVLTVDGITAGLLVLASFAAGRHALAAQDKTH